MSNAMAELNDTRWDEASGIGVELQASGRVRAGVTVWGGGRHDPHALITDWINPLDAAARTRFVQERLEEPYREPALRLLGELATAVARGREPVSPTEAHFKPKGPGLPEEEPWPDPVDGGNLFRSLIATLRRYVVFPFEEAAPMAALWIMFAHAHDAFEFSPLLIATSAARASGKSRLIDLLRLLCPRPLPTVNISDAALFRAIDQERPTVLVDEGDNINWGQRPELIGMLNAGYGRAGAYVIRCVGDGAAMETRKFSVWCPKAIAFLNAQKVLPDTTISRAVVIPMRRRDHRTEPITRFQELRATRELAPLRRQAARWAVDHAAALAAADPDLPEDLTDRVADAWSPLFAIADEVGIGSEARKAALSVSGAPDTQGLGEQLLADIRAVFTAQGVDRLASAMLAEKLRDLEGQPWAEWGRTGRGLSVNQLAQHLEPFGIRPRTIRIEDSTLRGYRREQFADAFSRYLSPECNTATRGESVGLTPDSRAKHAEAMLHRENAHKSLVSTECCGVAVWSPAAAADGGLGDRHGISINPGGR